MPQYTLNPNAWVKPADITGAYSKGFGLGLQGGEAQARIAMERARLNQQSQHTALSLALEQQKQERDSMVEQQKLEILKAYHQQEAELGHQKLDQIEEGIQQKIKEAAAHTLAYENYKSAIAGGMTPIEATLQFAGGMGPQARAAWSTALRENNRAADQKTYQPQYFELPGGIKGVYSPKTGTPHFVPQEKTANISPSQAGELLKKSQYADSETFGGDEALKQYQKGLIDIIKQGFGGNQPAHPFENKTVKDKRDGTISRVINGVPIPLSVLSSIEGPNSTPPQDEPPNSTPPEDQPGDEESQ